MHVVFWGFTPHSPHFETQLELIEDHLAVEDEVIYISCDAAVGHCDANPNNDMIFCLACQGKRRRGLNMLSKRIRVLPFSQLLHSEKAGGGVDFGGFKKLSDLDSLHVDGYDLGEAVSSSLQSNAQTVYPDMIEHADFISRALNSSLVIYQGARRYLQSHKTDLVYVFNGRAATGRGVLRACQQHRVLCFTHERGSTVDSYVLIKNTVPHDVDYRQSEIRKHWVDNPDVVEKERIAAQFYSNMRKGKLAYRETNYLRHQEAGCLPEYWQTGIERVVFFSSTETERSALRGFYQRRIYTSLSDMLTRIVKDLAINKFSGVFVLRMHPNSKDEFEHLVPHLEALKSVGFFHVISPTEKADTYALLDSADKVLVTTSTIGMEAAYSGVPCISLERSNYDLLGSCYAPKSHDEVISQILSKLSPMGKIGALMFGYYTLTFGKRFQRIKMQGQNKCSFNGQRLRSPLWLDWLMKLRRKLKNNF